jgi:hypothetical protein
MGRKTNHARNNATKFQTNLLEGLLTHRRMEHRSNPQDKVSAQEMDKMERGAAHLQAAPKTKYTNAKGAADHLGISKATFCRLKAKGFFQPSPITGRYHLDDLDREARGALSTQNGRAAADAQTQKTFGHPETMPPLAHGERMSNQ